MSSNLRFPIKFFDVSLTFYKYLTPPPLVGKVLGKFTRAQIEIPGTHMKNRCGSMCL